jgi:1-acyl-sn-glycerol-3-phosphate acyltransferase
MTTGVSKTEPVFQRGWLPPWALEVLRAIFAGLFWLLSRVEVTGLENLPTSGGFIISPNHLSILDAPLMFSLLKGHTATAFVADTYRRQAFIKLIVRSIDVIWVQRGAIGPSTLKYAIQALRRGSIVGVAPEGTRSKSGALIEGKTGAAFLASAAGVPIIPVAFDNSEKILPSAMKFKRERVTVTIGEPIYFQSANGRRPDSATLEAQTDELMCRIAAMLPPERRGLYADHPRLKEFLSA